MQKNDFLHYQPLGDFKNVSKNTSAVLFDRLSAEKSMRECNNPLFRKKNTTFEHGFFYQVYIAHYQVERHPLGKKEMYQVKSTYFVYPQVYLVISTHLVAHTG
jgi:hypothetical protein